MTLFEVQCRQNYSSGSSYGPYVINTWHFSQGPALGNTLADSAERARLGIIAFWNGEVAGHSLGGLLSGLLDGFLHFRYREVPPAGGPGTSPAHAWIDLSGATVVDHTVAFQALPSEAALCFTFRCDPYASYRRQSYYNRVYLGPFNIQALGDNGRPSSAVMNAMISAGGFLQTEVSDVGLSVTDFVVYSPKHGTAGPVSDGWVDNEWDTQRRRGLEVTERRRVVV